MSLSRPTRLRRVLSSVPLESESVPLERGSVGPVRLRVLPRHLEHLSNPALRRVARVREVLEKGERAGVAANLVRRRRPLLLAGNPESWRWRWPPSPPCTSESNRRAGAKVACQRPQRLHHGKDAIVRITRAQTAVRQRFLDDHLHPRLLGLEYAHRGLFHDVPWPGRSRRVWPVRRRHRHGSRRASACSTPDSVRPIFTPSRLELAQLRDDVFFATRRFAVARGIWYRRRYGRAGRRTVDTAARGFPRCAP